MQRAFRAFFLAVVWLAVPGWAFAPGGHVPVEEIRQILRTQLFPPPAESDLQGLPQDNLPRGIGQLDLYARYFPAEEATKLHGEKAPWTGIGAQLFARNDSMLLSPYPGGALAQSGISERSSLLEIDGHAVHGRTPSEVAAMLQGQPGSLVRLRLRPMFKESDRTVAVVRSIFRPLAVELIQATQQPVLRIRDFVAGQTRSSLKASIDFIDLQEGPLIIDLCESGGGNLFEALDCAGLFVSQGKSLGGLMTRESGKSMGFSPPGDKASMPVVLLIGPDTASAAEVFAAALAYHGRARLVGRPTFGKCTTQTEVTLSDGSILRFTNGRILAPGSRSCAAEGLEPELEIPESRLYDLEYMVSQALMRTKN